VIEKRGLRTLNTRTALCVCVCAFKCPRFPVLYVMAPHQTQDLKGGFTHTMPFPCRSLPHNVNQMGKTQSKAVEKRHGRGTAGERHGNGRGTAWEQHGNGMVCVNPP
jgi:hypothetical protein